MRCFNKENNLIIHEFVKYNSDLLYIDRQSNDLIILVTPWLIYFIWVDVSSYLINESYTTQLQVAAGLKLFDHYKVDLDTILKCRVLGFVFIQKKTWI